jgi:hypothetical protein
MKILLSMLRFSNVACWQIGRFSALKAKFLWTLGKFGHELDK